MPRRSHFSTAGVAGRSYYTRRQSTAEVKRRVTRVRIKGIKEHGSGHVYGAVWAGRGSGSVSHFLLPGHPQVRMLGLKLFGYRHTRAALRRGMPAYACLQQGGSSGWLASLPLPPSPGLLDDEGAGAAATGLLMLCVCKSLWQPGATEPSQSRPLRRCERRQPLAGGAAASVRRREATRQPERTCQEAAPGHHGGLGGPVPGQTYCPLDAAPCHNRGGQCKCGRSRSSVCVCPPRAHD